MVPVLMGMGMGLAQESGSCAGHQLGINKDELGWDSAQSWK